MKYGWGNTFKTASCVAIFLTSGVNAFAVSKKQPDSNPTIVPNSGDQCEGKFALPAQLLSELMKDTAHIAVQHKFSELPSLLKNHPLMMMTAAQKGLAVINHFGWRSVVDPVYKTRRFQVPKIFHDALPEAGGIYIVNQYEASQRMATYLSDIALKLKGSKGLAMMGPPGTGKTVFELVLRNTLSNMASTDSKFEDFTFQWTNLGEIAKDPAIGPALKKFLDSTGETLAVTTLKRSPFSLLPANVKSFYARQFGEKASQMLGFDLGDFYSQYASSTLEADPHSEALINEFLIPYWKKTVLGKTDVALSANDYLSMLDKFVVITRRDTNAQNKMPIIRPMEGNPDINALIGTTNIAAKLKGANGPLGFHFNGDVANGDGGMIFWDDFLRNDPVVLDFLLSVLQEDVFKGSESPELHADVVNVFSANYGSLKNAEAKGDTTALLSRIEPVPVKLLLNPTSIVQTLLVSLTPSNFSARKLQENTYYALSSKHRVKKDGDTPATAGISIKDVFPEPDSSGNQVGSDGRFALRVRGGIKIKAESGSSEDSEQNIMTSSPVEISPHSLEYLGLIAAATRLVTDPDKLKEANKLSGISSVDLRWFTDYIDRLRVITGEERLDKPEVLAALSELSRPSLLNEGDLGMAQRDLEVWFKTAIQLAQRDRSGNTLTPIEIRDALREAIADNQFKAQPEYSKWLAISERVASELILPRLMSDVNAIIANDGDLLRTVYDSVTAELMALASNQNATVYQVHGGERIPIDLERLRDISEIFKNRNRRQLNPIDFQAFYTSVSLQGSDGLTESVPMWTPLKNAISDYLVKTKASMGEYKAMMSYFSGQPVSQDVAQKGKIIQDSLGKFGYNSRSFVQALRFLNEYSNKLDRANRQQ